MASGVSLLLKGIGALVSFTVVILLVFVNGIMTQMMMPFVMGGTYAQAFGIDMIPIIQYAIAFMALATGILCFASAWIEVFAEVAYYPGY